MNNNTDLQEISHKLHVLVIVRHPIGGIRTFLRYVYSRFDKKKYKFTILLPETPQLNALQSDLSDIDCRFVVLQENAGIVSFIQNIFSYLRRERVDVVHSHGVTAMVFSVLTLLLVRKPHLVTLHDTFTKKQFVGIKGLLIRNILGFSFRFVDCIHSVSHDSQNNLVQYFPQLGQKSSELVVIQNGIEIERFFIDEQEDWRAQLDLPQQVFFIGFFGRFMAQKGFNYLVDAMKILQLQKLKVQPVVLAFGWGGFIREEQAVIKQKGLESFFRFLPFQENPARAMRGVDVIVMPSLWEACGLLAMESLVAGVPIIGTSCIGLREVLKDTPARVVPPRDSQELAEAILQEMTNPSTVNFKGYQQKAAKRFDVKERADELNNLYRAIISKS